LVELTVDDAELCRLLTLERYPRSAAYDPRRVIDGMMGPNALWLAEALSQVMPLRTGARVLDLGCGQALSSIFLAREFGVQVWATDLWIKPSDNWQRVQHDGLTDRVYPIEAEAHNLPFADGFFDALVSFDAYHYFGTDDLYLAYCARFVRPGGQISMVSPGFVEEPDTLPPRHLAPHWDPAMSSFHSPAWWRRHWEQAGVVEVTTADLVPDGWEQWLHWTQVCAQAGRGYEPEAELLRADGGRTLGFVRIVAQRT
jgi:cyclopropane fatty-acyl-phospholipid synthase-like methyltransferase